VNTAIFSLIDTLLIRLLPVRNPNELVILAVALYDMTGIAVEPFQ
jgi:hypothetical protein